MSALPEPASFEPFLPDVYRFALLMTGESAAAAAVLRRVVERAARGGIGDLRDARRVKRWLFTEARHVCTQPAAPPPPGPPVDPPPPLEPDSAPSASPLAARFAPLPTTERGALILFYLYLFDPSDLAEVLEIPSAELAPVLTRGRALLGPSS